MKDLISPSIHDVTKAILEDYGHGRPIDKLDVFNQPDTKVIYELINELVRVAYPGFSKDKAYRIYDIIVLTAALTLGFSTSCSPVPGSGTGSVLSFEHPAASSATAVSTP